MMHGRSSGSRDSKETRSKIIKVAFDLFARHGFEGTSIRDISRECGVNLAAINYHFKHKDNLFWEIMANNYVEVDSQIAKFKIESTDSIDLAMRVFDYFSSHKSVSLNAMKMLLNSVRPPQSLEVATIINNPMGPPGGACFAEMLQKDIPFTLSESGKMWGVKAIFGAVFHWSIMLCTDYFSESNDPQLSNEQLRADTKEMVISTLNHIKNNPQKFSAAGGI